MGKRGPAKTPTRILQLRGSPLAKQREGEPQPDPGIPEKPFALSPAGDTVWDEVTTLLGSVGLVTPLDGRPLARYCELVGVWNDLRAFLEKSGTAHPVKNRAGEIVGVRMYPQLKAALHVSEHLLRLESHFGLTPSARANLAGQTPVVEDADGSPFARRIG